MSIESVISRVKMFFKASGRPNNLKVPNPAGGGITYGWEETASGRRLTALVAQEVLEGNLQRDDAAIATFLLCLAYWLEKADPGSPVTCHLTVKASPEQPSGIKLRHLRRSLFILNEYQSLFPGRFVVDAPGLAWSWPKETLLTDPESDRSNASTAKPSDRVRESWLERQFVEDPRLLSGFPDRVAPPSRFYRQFPVGLFDGTVSSRTHWTPGGGSQVDLWGHSQDGKTLHLIELKGDGNNKAGIIPEAFYYARLLGYARSARRSAGIPKIGCQPEWDGFNAARAADRIVMWLIAPKFHPLLLTARASPLEWFNTALSVEGIEFRILPFELVKEGIGQWRTEEVWPVPL